ncbi:histidine phosphatase family protein [Planococcus shixiaomingii]|uniref:histidine phosphatase family protein n=1 Tax=Planococcus shixiaomingii TaxID=3058393 RepID=UPI0026338832|nr:histidine phosphatase family protein [Planococcus sp. N022]WKA54745.1 histidine phosphatase family protein [Planococcus sp. N022]
MEISMIRHGKSQWVQSGAVTFREFNQWIENYNSHGIDEEFVCPPETLRKAAEASIVITSDLKRSVESAMLINPHANLISSPLFREVELPAGSMKLFGLKLRPSFWAISLRLLWFGGYSKNCESLRKARLRAKKAAQQLIGYTDQHQSVVLIGHGFFNMLIAKELQKAGWKGERKLGTKHWNCISYSLLE